MIFLNKERKINMDNFKIMYKILRELEKNMGNENFSVKTVSAEKNENIF